MHGINLVMTITDRSKLEEFVSFYHEYGVFRILTFLGKGTASVSVLDYLGLEDTEKAVLLCALPGSRVREFVRDASKALWLDVPGNGILLTLPVASLGGIATKEYLIQDQPMEAEKDMTEKEWTHELIVVITNQGHTDEVMEAAREAGAGGGTVIHAKGTGAELAKKFFGVSIASEKEMVFIVAKTESRTPIMKAVMSRTGVKTSAQSFVFSLPVSDVAGLRKLEEE